MEAISVYQYAGLGGSLKREQHSSIDSVVFQFIYAEYTPELLLWNLPG